MLKGLDQFPFLKTQAIFCLFQWIFLILLSSRRPWLQFFHFLEALLLLPCKWYLFPIWILTISDSCLISSLAYELVESRYILVSHIASHIASTCKIYLWIIYKADELPQIFKVFQTYYDITGFKLISPEFILYIHQSLSVS